MRVCLVRACASVCVCVCARALTCVGACVIVYVRGRQNYTELGGMMQIVIIVVESRWCEADSTGTTEEGV